MEIDKIISLIQAVSDSKLTSFTYEKDGVKLKFGCETPNIVAAAPVVTAESYAAGMAAGQLAVNPMTVGQMAASQAGVIPVAAGQTAETAAESVAEAAGNIVKSPLVGTFYATPSEDAAPFVAVGDVVKKGQTLAIVEAMKLMNDIESDFDGKIAEIYVKSGEPVEYGQPLFRIA